LNWKKQDEHTKKTKEDRERWMADRANLQKLRLQLQNEGAERARRMRKVLLDEKGRESEDRQARAQAFVQNQRELAMRKRDEKTKLDFQKAAILEEFREQLRKGGKLDVEQLALKYGLDIEELRRKVEEGGRPQAVDTEQEEGGDESKADTE
jgi:hypothetical protein